MKRDVDGPWTLSCGRADSEVEKEGRPPGWDHPIWGFEVGRAVEGADGFQVDGGEEEGVRELVAVGEEEGGKCEVGVEGARRLSWVGGAGWQWCGGESEAEGGMESRGREEVGCEGVGGMLFDGLIS